ncbi:sigma-70 family RNA polymerase sigma factor [Tautonia rosea]|uniref:sigma-70 family RNA polymerase sigma factor n=1 Tax=Tautonia rosea TaxID=2728037 RepID=UPI001472C3FB|nr:RNA polymerase sigma factor RpoD/SigA [Tautonia rosea]
MSYTTLTSQQSDRTPPSRATLRGREPPRARGSPRTTQPRRSVRVCQDRRFPDRPIDVYSDQIRPYALLTAAEERAMGEASLRGDLEARERLVLANVRLVMTIARDFLGRGLSMDDLVGEGNLGLLRAAREFDPGFGVRFSTYASYWIKESILRALKTTTAPIRLPIYLINLLTKWNRTERALLQQLGIPPSHDQIAASLGLKRAQRQMVEQALRVHRCQIGSPSEEENPFAEAAAHVDHPETRLDQQESRQKLGQTLKTLDPIECKILTLHFGLDHQPPRTLTQISEALGLSRDRVRKIEARALRSLKRAWQDTMEGHPPPVEAS